MNSKRFEPFYRPAGSKIVGSGSGSRDYQQQLYNPESPRDSLSPASCQSDEKNRGYSRPPSIYETQDYREDSAFSRFYLSSSSSSERRSHSPGDGPQVPPAPSLSSPPPRGRGYPSSSLDLKRNPPTAQRHVPFDPFEDYGDMDSPGSRSRSRSWSPQSGGDETCDDRGKRNLRGDKKFPSPPPAPSLSKDDEKEPEANPLSLLLGNKNVSLSSLLEAVLEPGGNKNVVQDPALKKKVLLNCQTTIAMLYRSRVSGLGSFVPQPVKPVNVEAHDNSNPLLLQHPRLEFNAFPVDVSWKCPIVSVEVNKLENPLRNDGGMNSEFGKDSEVGMPISTVVNVKDMVKAPEPPPRPIEYMSHLSTSQPFYTLPPVYYPPRQTYPQMPYSQPQSVLNAPVQFPRSESPEKERREKKKKKKRARSRSRSRGRHRSRSRHGSRGHRRSPNRRRSQSRRRSRSRGKSKGSRGRSRGRRSRSRSTEKWQPPPPMTQQNLASANPWQPPLFNQNFPPQPCLNYPPPFPPTPFWRPPPLTVPPSFMPQPRPDWIHPSNLNPLPQPVAPPMNWQPPPVGSVPAPPGSHPVTLPVSSPSFPTSGSMDFGKFSGVVPPAFPSNTYVTRNERVLVPLTGGNHYNSPQPGSNGNRQLEVVDLTESTDNREFGVKENIFLRKRPRESDEKLLNDNQERKCDRDRDWQYKPDMDRSRSTSRSRENYRDHYRYRDRDKDRARDQDKDRNKETDRNIKDKSRETDENRSSDRLKSRESERRKERKSDDRKRDSSVEPKKNSGSTGSTSKSIEKDDKRSANENTLAKSSEKRNDSRRNDETAGKEDQMSRSCGSTPSTGLREDNKNLERAKDARVTAPEEGTGGPNEKDQENILNKKLDSKLERIPKLIACIIKLQRDSWELRELIKGLEARPTERRDVYTMRNRILCRVCVKSREKLLKVVMPTSATRQFLEDLHSNYHDMNLDEVVDLLTDTFHEIPGPKTKLGLIMKECLVCAQNTRRCGGMPEKRPSVSLLSDYAQNNSASSETSEDGLQSPKRKRLRTRHRKRKAGPKPTDNVSDSAPSPPLPQTAETFLRVASGAETSLLAATASPFSPAGLRREGQQDFKSLVRQVQMSKIEFKIIVNRLESNNRADLDPSFVMKGGMLCKKCLIDGKSEIRIIIKNEQLNEMIKIVHELGPSHAPLKKTLEVFRKHFNPIENLDVIVTNLINNCLVCKNKK